MSVEVKEEIFGDNYTYLFISTDFKVPNTEIKFFCALFKTAIPEEKKVSILGD